MDNGRILEGGYGYGTCAAIVFRAAYMYTIFGTQ